MASGQKTLFLEEEAHPFLRLQAPQPREGCRVPRTDLRPAHSPRDWGEGTSLRLHVRLCPVLLPALESRLDGMSGFFSGTTSHSHICP